MIGHKHLRLRYYTSLEEAVLVRLWREHLHEISSYSENLAIFRDISFGLQRVGIRLNKQEVRRRLNSYRNKYLSERSRLDSNPEYKSDWRLYPLIDSLLNPSRPTTIECNPRNVIEAAAAKARADLPALPPIQYPQGAPIKFERNPDGCAFLEPSELTPVLKTEPPSVPCDFIKTEEKPTELELATAVAGYATPAFDSTNRRAPLAPANHQLAVAVEVQTAATVNGLGEASKKKRGRRSIMPRTGQITMAMIEGLRKENESLEADIDTSRRLLEQKEKQFVVIQQSVLAYLDHQEAMLSQLLRHNIKNS
ncbi:uncharacterized protein [Drosophila bipectinata]|uniref:uncharacterized protein n=1 Tax=Drosophila bipectinata TaxID=42026 RepID=UPI001C8A4F3B|nr:uncharacterized protein LOC108126688 [Drosophila bipectinata]